jgi:hypothetical protein
MILNYPTNVKPTLSKDIAKKGSTLMSSLPKKGLGKATCGGLNDPCILNGTVGSQLTKLIKK